jgi:dCTP diphosphatase
MAVHLIRLPTGCARFDSGSTLDSTTTVGELRSRVAQFRDERNWAQFHNPKDLAVSISIEAGELLELFQWKNPQEVAELLASPEKSQEICEELADIVIYCLSAADALGADLSDAIVAKVEANARKYPVHKSRNSAAKYTEL